MNTYIALLRGINVGGNKIIKMLDLKAMFQSMDLHNVRTYIQSGNVIFESNEGSVDILSAAIERRIKDVFGFDVPVILRTLEELENTLLNNPFDLPEAADLKRMYVTFLAAEPSPEVLDKLRVYEDGPDKLRFVGKEMYVLYEISISQSALSKVPLDKILGIPATTRNWNTVNKLAVMARI